MSAIRKTYMAKHRSGLQIYAYVDGKPVLCEFKNASRFNKLIRGTYSTNNPDLIKALEKDSGFNTKYILQSESKDDSGVIDGLQFRSLEINPESEKEVKEAVKQPEAKKVEPVIPTATSNENKDAADIRVITKDVVGNVQEAKEWLKENFKDLTLKQLGNKKIVLEVAKAKGVTFEGVIE